MRPAFSFSQIATGDLDVAVVRQLPPNLSLGNEFEPGPMKMVGFEAAFRRRGLRNEDLEHASGNTHDPLIIFSDPYTEPDDGALGLALALVISAATSS
jgi:hypothetical protein